MRSGAAVFVEKPLSHDAAGVDDVTALASSLGATVAVGCQLRFHPALVDMKHLLEEEAIGRVITVVAEQGEYLPSYHPYEDYRESYAARSDLGGGVILTQIHELDYLHWIFGVPRSVFAVGGTIGDLEIDVEDSVDALLACGTNESPLAVHVHLDFLQRPSRRTCRVVGEAGTIDVDLLSPSLTWTNTDNEVVARHTYPEFDRAKMFVDEMRHFLDAVRDGGPVTVSIAHAAKTLRIAMAIRQSIATGELQTLS